MFGRRRWFRGVPSRSPPEGPENAQVEVSTEGVYRVSLSCGAFSTQVELHGASCTQMRALLSAVTSLITAAGARGVIPRLTQKLVELESGLLARAISNSEGNCEFSSHRHID